MYSYGAGGPLSEADAPELTFLNKKFASEGYRVPQLLRTIALSNAFSQAAEAPVPKTAAPAKTASLTSAAPAAQ